MSKSERDQFLKNLFEKGQITKDYYYRERTEKGIAAAVAKLRSSVRYSFAVNALIDGGYVEITDTNLTYDPECIKTIASIDLPDSALEEFECVNYFRLYKFPWDGYQDFTYLLVESRIKEIQTGVIGFFLVSDSGRGVITDRMAGSERADGRFEFLTMNGIRVMVLSSDNWSTGHFHEDKVLFTVTGRKFKRLFETRSLEIFAPPDVGELMGRRMRRIIFRDFDGDGMLDIGEECRTDLIDKSTSKESNLENYTQLPTRKKVSRSETKYYWNNDKRSFESRPETKL